MLVITRLHGESIILDTGESEITVKLIITEVNQAKLGICAPDEVKIMKEELLWDSG